MIYPYHCISLFLFIQLLCLQYLTMRLAYAYSDFICSSHSIQKEARRWDMIPMTQTVMAALIKILLEDSIKEVKILLQFPWSNKSRSFPRDILQKNYEVLSCDASDYFQQFAHLENYSICSACIRSFEHEREVYAPDVQVLL